MLDHETNIAQVILRYYGGSFMAVGYLALWPNVVGATCGRPWGKPPLSYMGKIIDAEIAKISDVYENVLIENM